MASTCAGCGKAAESGVLVNGQTFHPDCFKCKGCSKPLAGAPFFTSSAGSVLCADCNAEAGPKCATCGKGMQRWTEIAGSKYHPECAPAGGLLQGQPTCGTCGRGFTGKLPTLIGTYFLY